LIEEQSLTLINAGYIGGSSIAQRGACLSLEYWTPQEDSSYD